MNKVLIIKSDLARSQLPLVINRLSKSQFKFTIFTSDKKFANSIDVKTSVHLRRSIEEIQTYGDFLFFTIFSPLLWLYLMGRLILFRFKKHRLLFLTSLQEKLLITPWARLLGFKVIWFENNYFDPSFKLNLYSFLYRLWSHFSTIVTTSKALNDYLQEDFNIKEKHIKTINRGLDLKKLQQQSDIYEDLVNKEYQIQNKSLFIIGFIGSLKQENGIEYLIKAIEHFKDLIPNFQIIVVGDGKQKKSLLWLTKMMGLSTNIRFIGLQKNIQRWYKYFDVFVFPRIARTNFSNVVAEALANGIPVVSTQVPGIEEIVNQQGGILVEPKNPEKLAEAIFQIYNNANLRSSFSKQATARIQKNYSIENLIKAYTELLSK